MNIRLINDWSGMGRVMAIVATQADDTDIQLWSWAFHIDGPPHPEVVHLLTCLFGKERVVDPVPE